MGPAMKARTVAPMLALVLVALAACGQGRLPAGPLQPEKNHIVIGQPVLRTGAITIAADALYNGGAKQAVIDRVVIVSPRHIKLLGAYVVIGTVIGNFEGFPPSFSISKGRYDRYAMRMWATRHLAVGAVIPPHKLGGLSLGLSVTAAQGSLAHTDVYYHVGSTHYEWRGSVRIVLTSVDCRAPATKPTRTFCRLYGH
jgi:hypothetical protein